LKIIRHCWKRNIQDWSVPLLARLNDCQKWGTHCN